MEIDQCSIQADPKYAPLGSTIGPSVLGLRKRLELEERCRVGLRERIHNQAAHAQQEGNKASRLYELAELLDKNPVVARILELLEEVRG